MAALEELEREYERAKRDRKFQARLTGVAADLCGASDAVVFCAAAYAEAGRGEDLFEA
jgi:tryptophan synthase beta subunit